jgi:Na+-translocating ferredoxin:NAD+ oxidoreductase subunit E
MPLLSQEEPLTLDTFLRGIWKENPVFVTLLGNCPVLAVTNSATNAISMGLATLFVLLCSNVLVSMLRKVIPKQVRIASYIVLIASFVTVVDYAIQAISLEVYEALGAFIQLIVVNCIILGRAEAYASRQTVIATAVNSVGTGIGFTLALLCLGVVRELLGAGTLFGVRILPDQFQPWVLMLLPAGGFFVLAGWLLLIDWMNIRRERRALEQQGVIVDGR